MSSPEYLDDAIQAHDARLDARFAQTDTRFVHIDTCFAQVEGRFEQLHAQIDAVRHDLLAATRGEVIAALARQTRQMIIAMIGTVLSLAALARLI